MTKDQLRRLAQKVSEVAEESAEARNVAEVIMALNEAIDGIDKEVDGACELYTKASISFVSIMSEKFMADADEQTRASLTLIREMMAESNRLQLVLMRAILSRVSGRTVS